jgi:hypothetical protein
MFALVAAILFALALLLDLLRTSIGDLITSTTLMLAGLTLLALHFAPMKGRVYRRRRR